MSATFFLMVEALLQKVVRARRIVSLDLKSAQALSDPVRGKILEAIFHKPMTAEELAGALENSGSKKAVTTIRHHLDALKTAGLIEASKMVEVRGALMKYYAPTIRAFAFQTP
ncbi:MAG TPA: helix-turn-helix domain-containing protein, partial [Nitrososphaera sp.]|nr:helix-turn-helix domain-containing protein [Nitrososphaera sp.]